MQIFQNRNNSVLKIGSALFTAIISAILATSSRPLAAAEPPVLSSTSSLFTLSPKQLAEDRSFEFQGIVLCFDNDWNQLFVQSAQRTAYFSPQLLHTNLRSGDLVRISTRITRTTDAGPLTNLSTVILGRAALPSPRKIELSDLGVTAGSWVELTGAVRGAESSHGRLALTFGKAAASCVAYVLGSLTTNDCKSYVGSLVRIRAVNTSHLLDGRVTEASLMAPDISQVTVLQPPAIPIGSLPVLSIDALLNRELGPWTNLPVRLNGIVISVLPGDTILVRDATGLLHAHLRQVTAVAPGDAVDLWGYLDSFAGQPVLTDAYFEPMGPAAAVVASPVTFTNGPLPVVTNVVTLRTLPRQVVAQGVPVTLRGVVIYTDPDWHTAFLNDGTASVYAELNQSNVELGQLAVLTGRATPGAYAPAILPAHFQTLGRTNLPAAVPADLDDVAAGNLDAQWVEMRGIVRRATSAWGHLHLCIMSRQGRFNAVVPGYSSDEAPAGLLNSRVSLQGVCGSDLNARRQLSGITIYVPNLSHIKTIEPAPIDPFDASASPIATVATFDPERIAGRRVKVAGVVSLNLPGFGLFLLDDSGAIRVQTQLSQAIDLVPGDSVEILGFPALGDFSPHLEEPVIRRLSSGQPLVPRVTTAEQILLQGTNDAALVCLDAKLLQSVPRSAQPKLVLQQGPLIFTAQLTGGHFADAVSNWRPGSLLRLTGVCLIQGNDTHNPQSFRLLLSGPDHVRLLKAPPAWSLRSFLLLAGLLAITTITALSWIVALRRQVRVRTAELHASQVDLQRQVDHSRELSELGRRLNEAASPREAALIIADVADRLIGWDSCVCNMYSPETDLMTHVINIDLVDGRRCETQPEVSQVHPSALARRAIGSGAQLILRRPTDLARPDGIAFGDTSRPSASILYVPMHKGSTIVGVLSIQSYTLDDYNEQDVTMLQALADHCSGALDRIRAHRQLVEISRQAGMAEVATGVLHNVGNVLNSVNVSVALLLDRSRDSHAARLARIASLLNDHSHDLPGFFSGDPKGQMIPSYLSQLSEIISADEGKVRAELESLTRNVDHIKEIVSMQQSYARLAGVAENVTPAELVEDAIRLNAGSLSRHKVEVQRSFAPNLPVVSVDKHKVLQILINLIRNAKYACDESGRADKKLVVSIANGANRLHISVADNGVGIPRDNLTRIFSMGFSTRKNGHGFGLHSGALAAKELGGSLTVHSDGPGAGAAFTLELPLTAKN